MDTEKLFCLSTSVQVPSPGMTTPRDSYAWDDTGLATLFTFSESSANGVSEPLTIGSMHTNLTTELSRHNALRYLSGHKISAMSFIEVDVQDIF